MLAKPALTRLTNVTKILNARTGDNSMVPSRGRWRCSLDRTLAYMLLFSAVGPGCDERGLGVYLPPPPWAWLCTAPGEPLSVMPVRGANLVGFRNSEYVGPDARVDQSLEAFSAVGGNWVAVSFWWFQDRLDSTEIGPDPTIYTITDEAIAAAIEAAHELGLNVMLRPMVDLRDGTWRRFILPSSDWFQSYVEFISYYARQASAWDAEAYSIGVELTLTESWEDHWRDVISVVRAAYGGPLVYCAACDTAADLAWWDAVDVIGIDAYYSVAVGPNDPERFMTCAWSHWLDLIERQIVEVHPDKPVWLTELGVRSAHGAARLPWCYNDPCFFLVDGHTVDLGQQANYYRAALRAAGARPWLQGMFWWAWNADPDAPYLGDTDYSPQGKPAQDVLAEFWTGQR
jgi:hypothetical protein